MKEKALKSVLRRRTIQRILAMDPTSRKAQEAAMVGRLLELPGFDHASCVLLYASAFAEEFETRPLLELAVERGKRLILPRVIESEHRLRLFEVFGPVRDLVLSPRGIFEPRLDALEVSPREIDWVLVPGIAFNAQGNRLGRGAGHYDRLLPELRSDCPRWALILDSQWSEEVPVEPHDQRLNGVADHRQVLRVL